jgi:hypothetical protein
MRMTKPRIEMGKAFITNGEEECMQVISGRAFSKETTRKIKLRSVLERQNGVV